MRLALTCEARLGFRRFTGLVRETQAVGRRGPAAPRRDKSPGDSTARKEAPHDSSRRRNQHRGRRIRRLSRFEARRRRQRQFPRRRAHAAADVGRRRADGLGRRHQRHARQYRPGSRIRLLGGRLPTARARAVSVPDGRVLRQADEPDGADVVPGLLPAAVRQACRGRGIPDAHRGLLSSGRRKPGGRRLPLQLLPRHPVLAGRGHHRHPRGGLHRNRRPDRRRVHGDHPDVSRPHRRRRSADLDGRHPRHRDCGRHGSAGPGSDDRPRAGRHHQLGDADRARHR